MFRTMTFFRRNDESRRNGVLAACGSSLQAAPIHGAVQALHVPDPLARFAPPVWLYGLAVFAAAWLVFWIQPLAVRGVLPALGGAPAVWNTAMVFFQAALLAGYAFAHFMVRRLPPTGQLALLCVLWIGVAVTAPAGGLRPLGEAPGDLPPVLWLLGTMAGTLGVAFVAASSLTPLVQAWLARSGSGRASADPYVLYAASNAGSVGALLAYRARALVLRRLPDHRGRRRAHLPARDHAARRRVAAARRLDREPHHLLRDRHPLPRALLRARAPALAQRHRDGRTGHRLARLLHPPVQGSRLSGFHDPEVHDREDVLRLREMAFAHGALLGNGHNAVRNCIAEAGGRAAHRRLLDCAGEGR